LVDTSFNLQFSGCLLNHTQVQRTSNAVLYAPIFRTTSGTPVLLWSLPDRLVSLVYHFALSLELRTSRYTPSNRGFGA